MNRIEEIEERLIVEGIDLDRIKLRSNIKAFTINENGRYAIAFDETKCKSTVEKINVLEHEYSHIRTNSVYGIEASKSERLRNEHKANIDMIERLIDPKELKRLIEFGCHLWELADYFNVLEDVMKLAIVHYKNRNLI